MKSRILFSIILLALALTSIYYISPLSDKKPTNLKIDTSVTPQSLAKKCGGSALPGGEERAVNARYCYLKYFEVVLRVKGPEFTTKELAAWALKTGGLQGECHNVGHLLGRLSYKLYKFDSLKGNATVCAFSYGHGILQEASETLSRADVLKHFSNLCVGTTDANGCLHGYGHATADAGFDPVMSNEICDKQIELMKNDKAMNISNARAHTLAVVCMEGWAMEQFFIDNKFWITVTDPNKALAVCGTAAGAGGNGCRGSALRNWVIAPDYHQKDFTKEREKRLEWFRDYCLKQEPIYQSDCMGHVGLTTAEVWTLEMPNVVTVPYINKICIGKFQDRCIIALANSRWNRYGDSIEKVLPLCAMLRKDIGEVCRESLYTF